ncbi:MAG: hypothetical protein D8M59_15130 [Planctomycetes bacterium]|nr:hypothetical protein [Planctomycetota bacterium]
MHNRFLIYSSALLMAGAAVTCVQAEPPACACCAGKDEAETAQKAEDAPLLPGFWKQRATLDVQANAFTSSTQESTAVDVAADGRMVAVWTSRRQERGSYGIYAQQFDRAGQPIGDEVHVNQCLPGMQRRPDIVIDPHGNVWCVWESFGQDGQAGSVVARLFDRDMNPLTDEIPVNQSRDGTQYDPVIASNELGQVLIVWADDQMPQGSANPDLRARVYGPDGSPITDEFSVNNDRQGRDEKPVLTALPDGSFAVAWAQTDALGNPMGIAARSISSDGHPAPHTWMMTGTDEQLVPAIEPALASDSEGRLIGAWLEPRQDGYIVQCARFQSDGTPIGTVNTIATPDDGWKSGVAVAAADDGRFVIAYNADDANDKGGIEAHVFDANAKPLDDARTLTSYIDGQQRLAIASGARRLVWSDADQIVAAWDGDAGFGDSSAANLTLVLPEAMASAQAADGTTQETGRPTRVAALVSSSDFLNPIPPLWDENYVPQEPYLMPAAGPDFGFEGVPGTGWTPPDPELAVGPDRIVVMTNGQIAAFMKDGTNVFRDEIENSFGFWGELGANNFVFDPETCWDPHAQRFWAMACERSDTGRSTFLLAVSKDSSPDNRDDWWKWRLDVTSISGNDIDSPNMAVDANAVYLTADFFGPDKYLLYMLDKAPLLTGSLGTTNYELIVGSSQQSMGIPVTYDAGAPAQYIIQSTELSNNTKVIFHAMKDPFGSYTRQTVDVAVEPYQYPTQPPQKGSASRPYLFEPRFWSCVQRNGSVWATHHVNSSRARVRWYEFDMQGWPDSGQNPIVAQWGEIDLGDGIHTYFGSIGVDSAGNAALTYARSASDEYISMSRATRRASDPPGTFSGFEFVQESTAAHTSGRWGDYSFTQADPAADPGTFWGHHEFCTGGSWTWRTWIAQYVVDSGLVLVVDPLFAGFTADMTVTDATPAQKVYFTYSLAGSGSTYVSQLDVTLDLLSPKLAGDAVADGTGTAVLTKMVPLGAKNRLVWIQAAEYGKKSNLVATQVN